MDLAILVFWLLFGAAATYLWWGKGGSAGWAAVIGLILGPGALVLSFYLSPAFADRPHWSGLRRSCPSCREPMALDAEVCPTCTRESDPLDVGAIDGPDEAHAMILHAELRRHGPQTLGDLARTTGTSPGRARRAVRSLRKIDAVAVDGGRLRAS